MPWKDELPEDLRSVPIVAEAPDLPTLVKQTVDFQRMLGNSLRLPGEQATPEERAAFAEKAGKHGLIQKDKFTEFVRPEKPELYGIGEPPADAEALGLSQGIIDQWKADAHALGLSPSQFTAQAQARIAAMRETVKARTDAFDAANKALVDKWGDAATERKAMAMAAAERFGGKELVDALAANPDPKVLLALAEVGKAFSETGLGDLQTRPTFIETREEAAMKLSKIMNDPEHAYNKGASVVGSQAYDAVLGEVMRLRQLAAGVKPQKDYMYDLAS